MHVRSKIQLFLTAVIKQVTFQAAFSTHMKLSYAHTQYQVFL